MAAGIGRDESASRSQRLTEGSHACHGSGPGYVVSSDTSLGTLVDEVLDLPGAADVDNGRYPVRGVDADATTLPWTQSPTSLAA